MHPLVTVSEEVAAAISEGRPVVALESTIIAHGMPWPQNVDTARDVEAAVREEGAVPATIAVAGGRIRVGLDDRALDRLGRSDDVDKLSRRDLPIAIARGRLGATTVSATMICAHMAGIRIFATGGIGGVHRGAEHSFDISADLEELARTPVAVVCAGAKSILDLPKTLEYLETRGVPVIGLRTHEFPAFYARTSGVPLSICAEDEGEVAAILDAARRLGYPGGAVIANPIPVADALPRALIDDAIARALSDATRHGIAGKEVTPFLLKRIVEITRGGSLKANVALVLDNARAAARIATALGRYQ